MRTSDASAAFLSPILERYADDGPRLILADYLDESDAPADQGRAELIRTQCALARLPDDHPRRAALANRETELLCRYQAAWTESLRGLAVGFEWRRGLLDSVTVDAGTFLESGDELFRRVPVRRVRFLDAVRYIDRLAACPTLAGVRELDLCGNDLGNGGVNILLRSRFLGRVEVLDLSFNAIGDGGLALLARSPSLPRLRSLALTDYDSIGGEGVRSLAGSVLRSELRSLDLSGNDVNDAGIRALVESPYLIRLHTLRISANHIGDTGVAALAESTLLQRLVRRNPHLDLRQNGIGPAGAAALAASVHLAHVGSLDLSGNYLGSDGLAALAASPHLNRLKKLAIRRNQIADPGALALARSDLMPRLRLIDIAENRLTRRGVDALWNARRDFQTVLETGGNLVSSVPVQSPGQPEETDRTVSRLLTATLPVGTVLRPVNSAQPK